MQCLLVATLVWLGPPEDGAVDPAPRGDPGDPAAQAGETQLQRPASQPSAEPRVRPKPTGGPETARPHADPDVLEGAVQVEPPRTQLPGVGGGPQPHMGNGLIVAGVGFYGIGATVFGLASLASGFASDTIGPKFAAVMAVGAGVAGLGLTSMGFGIRQRKKFNRWVRANPDRRANRGTGTGMLAGGVVALSGGVLMVSVATATPVTEGSPGIGYTLVLGGIGGLVSGTALIIAGPVLYDRFRQERERHQLNLTPTLLRDGGGLSLSGRF